MKKKLLTMFLALILCAGFTAVPTFACTSFAVYSDQVIYGKNFDYSDSGINLSSCALQITGGVKTFQVQLSMPMGTGYDATMNEDGLFSCINQVNPPSLSPGDFDMTGFVTVTNTVEDVNAVKNILTKSTVGNMYGSYHLLFADPSGNAVVLENNGQLTQTPINGKYIVMTNFYNSTLQGKSYTDAEGVGADRYIIACQNIEANFKTFDVDAAFDTLQKTIQSSTHFSVVGDPANQVVYLAIHQNYGQIWKISLKDETVETYRGFQKPVIFNLHGTDVYFQTLMDYQIDGTITGVDPANYSFPKSPGLSWIWWTAGAVVIAAAGACIGLLIWKRAKRSRQASSR